MISMTKLDKIRALVREKWTSLRDQGALHIFIGSFITKFVAFFASIFIVHLFSKPDYGVLGYVENIFGYVYLLAGLLLACGTIPGAVLGAKLNAHMPERQLRLAFAAFLGVSAAMLVMNELGVL